jgi:hypothetical protein
MKEEASMAYDNDNRGPTYEELEANRRDPEWGDPVGDLDLHAWHWLTTAEALHPRRRRKLDALMVRLVAATCSSSAPDGWVTGASSAGEIALALEEILAVMKELAPLVVDPTGHR